MCFQGLRCGPTVRPRASCRDISRDELSEAGECGAVWHGTARPDGVLISDVSPNTMGWHPGRPDHGGIAGPVPVLPCSGDQALDFSRAVRSCTESEDLIPGCRGR